MTVNKCVFVNTQLSIAWSKLIMASTAVSPLTSISVEEVLETFLVICRSGVFGIVMFFLSSKRLTEI